MATWDDVRRIALGLPETVEHPGQGVPVWRVKDKMFVWERPLRRADFEALGDAAPDGPILGVRVPDVGAKEALLAENADVYFTTPHFDGYPAILVRLDRIAVDELDELIVEAWPRPGTETPGRRVPVGGAGRVVRRRVAGSPRAASGIGRPEPCGVTYF